MLNQKMGGERVNISSFRENSLNTIRLLAAFQVFYGHAVAHLELPGNEVVSEILNLFQGVPIFFMLSGFLIWRSLDRISNLKCFVKKRVLRLYPELWCAVLMSVFSIVILYNNFQIVELVLFIFGQATVFQFWTPDSLRGFGCGTPNGSLWTICVIVQFYMVAWFSKKLFCRQRCLSEWIIWLFASIVIGVVSPRFVCFLPDTMYKLYEQTIFPYLWIFLIGVFVCEYFDVLIPYLKKYWCLGLLGLVVVEILNFDIWGNYGILKTFLQTVVCLGFAYEFPNFNIKHDISYGVYLYHMIVINVMIQIGVVKQWWCFVWAALATITIAVLSDKLIANKLNSEEKL